MSEIAFKNAYTNADLIKLRTYVKCNKILSTKKFMNYVEASFMENREVYDILVLILFNQYDLNKVVKDIIYRDDVDLLENILDNDYGIALDESILETVYRLSMAKVIYEYIYDVKKNSYTHIKKLLHSSDMFEYDPDEDSIDSCILAISQGECTHAKKILTLIDPGFWNNFAIKYACECREISIVKRLLSHDAVDPGSNNESALKHAINYGYYEIANELVKHPLVRVDKINADFVKYIIQCNYLCVTKKIYASGNTDAISLFNDPGNFIDDCKNDVTEFIKKKKKPKYVQLPYELQLDPIQIYKKAIKNNDLDLAKSINYVLSINLCDLFSHLEYVKFGKKSNTISSYICNNVLKDYDIDELLIHLRDDEKWINNILKIADHFGLEINYKYVWCECNNEYMRKLMWRKCDNMHIRKNMWDDMKFHNRFNDCEKFITEVIGGKLCDDYYNLSRNDKISKLDKEFNKYINTKK